MVNIIMNDGKGFSERLEKLINTSDFCYDSIKNHVVVSYIIIIRLFLSQFEYFVSYKTTCSSALRSVISCVNLFFGAYIVEKKTRTMSKFTMVL